MAKLLKLRRGTTSQHSSFTGAEGEVTVDTTKDTLVVHDGSTAGGVPLAKEAGNIATATEATNITAVANNSTDETVYPTFVDGATGTQGIETDTGFTYNPNSGKLTATEFVGNVDAVDGDFDGTLEADAITVNGVALNEYIADTVGAMVTGNTETGITVTYEDSDNTLDFVTSGSASTATEATNVTVSANNSTDETVYPTFVDGATGTQGIETDTGLTYNPSTGLLTAVGLTLSGDLTVNGTTTTINSTTLAVDDKNIELGTVDTPSDTTADGGGWTLKGATDKTFNWVNATDAWTSSEHIALGDGKNLKLGDSSDLQIYHNSNNSWITNDTGSLFIKSDNAIKFQDAGGNEDFLSITDNGAVEIFHDNSKKFETTAAGVTVTGSVTDSKGDVRSIPLNQQTSAYVAVAADAGKAIYINSGGVTINNSVFSAGDAVTIINYSGSDQTITQGSSFTLYNSADASTGNRILAGRGMATIYFSGGSAGYISGAGLS
tara:strand:+ start:14633 stop:16111 length:1479 start_codon:yes stop_codon:yes gene_type:complete